MGSEVRAGFRLRTLNNYRTGLVGVLPLGSRFGALAQLVERFHGMEEARGSNPLSSTPRLISVSWGPNPIRAPQGASRLRSLRCAPFSPALKPTAQQIQHCLTRPRSI
jgi:hypothetical protein